MCMLEVMETVDRSHGCDLAMILRFCVAVAATTVVGRNVHAHLFRHGHAINFLNCSGRLDARQEQLGHRDINTTLIYLRLSDEDVKREVQKIQF